jgi:hypothetical protein
LNGEYNRSNHSVEIHSIQSKSHGGNQMAIQRGNKEINAQENTQTVVILNVKIENGSNQW